MSRFQEVKLGWGGKSYTIPANKVMGAIARVEDHVTLVELQRYTQNQQTMPMAKVAGAFANLLVYAGAEGVTAEDIYTAMFGVGDAQQQAITAVHVLLAMMVPPDQLAAKPGAKPGKSWPAAARSSKKRSRQRSLSTAG